MDEIKIRNRSEDVKANTLRAQGLIPGNFYGPEIQNRSVMMTKNDLTSALSEVGEVYKIPSGRGHTFVKFEEVQRDPVSQELLHFSLVKLPRNTRNEVMVPINFDVELENKDAIFLQLKDEIGVVGVPSKIPEEISMKLSKLEIGDKILVQDLKIPKNIEFTEEQDQVIAVCQPSAFAKSEIEEEAE